MRNNAMVLHIVVNVLQLMQQKLISRSLAGVAELLERYGCSPVEIAKQAGLHLEALYRDDVEVTPRQFNNILEGASIVCRERFFSAKLAQLRAKQGLESVWPALEGFRTVKDVLLYFADNLEQFTYGGASIILLQHDDGVSLFYEARRVTLKGRPLQDSLVQVIELCMVSVCYELRHMLSAQWEPRYVQFRHSPPTDTSPLKAILGSSLYFNQDANSIFLDNKDYHYILEKNNDCKDIPERPSSVEIYPASVVPFPLRVTRTILKLINLDECHLVRVAEELSTKPRTLQYRLKQYQTSYQSLYDAARHELARQYLLQSDLTVIAIAERLGFTDLAAFSNFFKRKSGLSPTAFLKSQSSE